MDLPTTARRSASRTSAWAYGAAALLALLLRPGLRALLVPAAGPWAARLYGHGCGLADAAPGTALALSVAGALAALGSFALRRRRAAAAPILAWWLLWVLAALASVTQTLE